MSGPKRNPDKLNTIGVVVVGICGAVLVYVTIVALQAFYVNDTSEVQTMADYGGQDTQARSLRTTQTGNITEYATNPRPAAPKPNEAAKLQSYHVPIDVAMKLVVEGARVDPSALIPAVGHSDKSTVLPIFGRPKLIPPPAPAAGTGSAAPAGAGSAAPAGAGSAAPTGAGSAAPAGAGSAAPAGAGSAAPAGAGAATTLPAAPMVPTGTGTGPSPVGGAGPLDKPSTPPAPKAGTAPAAKAGTAPKAGTPPAAKAGTAPAPKAGTPPAAGTAPAPKAGTPSAPKGNGK
jgi:hypothetical protein